MLIDITDFTDCELDLLLKLKADPDGLHDLAGVRATALPVILRAAGIPWSDSWAIMAARLHRGGAQLSDTTDYEGLILSDQEEWGDF